MRSRMPKPEWQSSAIENGRGRSSVAISVVSARASISIGAPSSPRYQGRAGLNRWPPSRKGTRSLDSSGALRIRSTPRGLARVPSHMPPGLQIGTNTRRTRSRMPCRLSSQDNLETRLRRKLSTTPLPIRSNPWTPPTKAIAGHCGAGLPRPMASTANCMSPTRTSQRVSTASASGAVATMAASSRISASGDDPSLIARRSARCGSACGLPARAADDRRSWRIPVAPVAIAGGGSPTMTCG